jgi:hypothetical protein
VPSSNDNPNPRSYVTHISPLHPPLPLTTPTPPNFATKVALSRELAAALDITERNAYQLLMRNRWVGDDAVLAYLDGQGNMKEGEVKDEVKDEVKKEVKNEMANKGKGEDEVQVENEVSNKGEGEVNIKGEVSNKSEVN